MKDCTTTSGNKIKKKVLYADKLNTINYLAQRVENPIICQYDKDKKTGDIFVRIPINAIETIQKTLKTIEEISRI